MAGIITIIKKGWGFVNEKLWVVRLDKLNKRQSFLIRQLRIFALAFKGFNEDKCLIKATALTFYTLFSIVPIFAIVFAIGKAFGYDEVLKNDLTKSGYGDSSTVLNQAFIYADRMLENARGSLIAGLGILLLLWSVISLLINIENSFNDIWEIKKGRTWYRKVTDYITIIIIAPIFLVVSSGLTVYLQYYSNSDAWILSTTMALLLKLVSFLMLAGVFAFIYIVLPNTRVTFKSAAIAALITAVLFELLQWTYINFQVGAGRLNAIYGTFAALPLFLIWVQYSWYIVLFGAELAFANQNVGHYELENEIQNISVRYKRVIALLICNRVVKNFHDGKKALNAKDLSTILDLPMRLSLTIINELVETKILSEIRTSSDKDIAYQPGISDSKLTVKYIINRLDEKGVNELPIHDAKELSTINGLLNDLDHVMNNPTGNMLVKDII
jgi:membrane protein